MGKGNTASQNFLKIFFQAVAWANVCDNAATSPLTNTYSSLHTADPTASGTQSSSEATYTSYARTATARTTGGYTLTGQTMNPAAAITFPAGTGGSGTATFWGIGTLVSGAGLLAYSGAISPSIVTGSGITPQLSTASAVTES